jgi:hypothetical protein
MPKPVEENRALTTGLYALNEPADERDGELLHKALVGASPLGQPVVLTDGARLVASSGQAHLRSPTTGRTSRSSGRTSA